MTPSINVFFNNVFIAYFYMVFISVLVPNQCFLMTKIYGLFFWIHIKLPQIPPLSIPKQNFRKLKLRLCTPHRHKTSSYWMECDKYWWWTKYICQKSTWESSSGKMQKGNLLHYFPLKIAVWVWWQPNKLMMLKKSYITRKCSLKSKNFNTFCVY